MDSVVVVGLPQLPSTTDWGAIIGAIATLVAVFVAAIMGFYSSNRMHRKEQQVKARDARVRAFNLLVAIVVEIRRNQEQITKCIQYTDHHKNEFLPIVLITEARRACLAEYVKDALDSKISAQIIAYYIQLDQVRFHQEQVICHQADPKISLSFMMQDYSAMANIYIQVLCHLKNELDELNRTKGRSNDLDFTIPQELSVDGECEIWRNHIDDVLGMLAEYMEQAKGN